MRAGYEGRDPTDDECVAAMRAINAAVRDGVAHQATKRALDAINHRSGVTRLLWALSDRGWVQLTAERSSNAVSVDWVTVEGREIGL